MQLERMCGFIAQLVEHRTGIAEVAGSNPCGFIAQLVEHRNGTAEVTGSNPVEALNFSGFFFPIA